MPSSSPPPPPYRRIAADLRAAIARGDLEVGDRLPSEAELMDSYGVARMTVRGAIAQLRGDGLVETRQGSGVFVIDTTVPAESGSPKPADPRTVSTPELLALLRRVTDEVARRLGG